MNDLLKIAKICVEKIKDEFLLFSVVALVIMVAFPDARFPIFVVYGTAVTMYVIITMIRIRGQKSDNKFLQNVEQYLGNPEDWEMRMIGNSEIYFYVEDNNYKIVQGDSSLRDWEPRIEPWMNNFPDAHVSEWSVYIKHGENIIAEYMFMSCDGARYFIPIPKKRCAEPGEGYTCNRFEYFWHRNSIEYKVAGVIGRFYNCENLEEVARFCGIITE